MPRFFLIDSWLSNAKGHNYQYALDIAGAAERRGYEPVLGVRRSLSSEVRFPATWRVERIFEFGESPRHWIGLDGRNPHPCDLSGAWLANSEISWWQRICGIPAAHNRTRQILSFSRACDQLFKVVRPNEDDILLLPSLTEFDFLCAARFWHDHPWTREFDWHLQFHFNFFLGRDPEFNQQPAVLHRFQQQFRAAVDEIPEHRLHFYATTEAVARQYDLIGIAIFHPLPYPVRPLCDSNHDVTPAEAHKPLRVTLPGGIRHEKGKKQIRWLIDTLWDEFLANNKLQLTFQATPKVLQQRLPKRLRRSARIHPAGLNAQPSPLMTAPHPLDAENYARFIRESDIGLMVYDSRRYFARASGVLCEMMSAGVPVIVPAGCWLADQIAEENYRHIESLWRQWQAKSRKETLDLSTRCETEPRTPRSLSHWVGVGATIEAADEPTQMLLIRFDWPSEAIAGTYLELVLHLEGDASMNQGRRILGWREEGPIAAAFRLDNVRAPIQVSIANAYDSRPLSISQIQILRLPAGVPIQPVARVGLIASDESEIPPLLHEMTNHYDHYRRTAREFAKQWQYAHAPDQTISILESRGPRHSVKCDVAKWPCAPSLTGKPKATA